MPAYNAGMWIEETITSLRQQTFADYELLIGDDGSTDGTLDIVNRLCQEDSRISLYQFPHRGVVATRNALIDRARGKFIMFHDADDLSAPSRMEHQLAFLENHASFVAISCQLLKFSGIINPATASPPADPTRWTECFFKLEPFRYHKKEFPFPGCMIRKDSVQEIGGFRPYFYNAEDSDFIYRLSDMGKMATLEATLLFYRQHHANTSIRAPYRQTESSVLSRVIALRRRAGKHDNLHAAKPPFIRIFTSGLSGGEILQTLWLLGTRLSYRYGKNFLRSVRKAPAKQKPQNPAPSPLGLQDP